MQGRKEFDEGGGGVHHRAAENARVEIERRSPHDDFHRGDAAEALGQGRVSLGDHSGVGNGDHVTAQVAAARTDELREICASDLLLALDEENQIHRQRTLLAEHADRPEDVREDLAFVVGGAARKDPFVADHRLERRRGPLAGRVLGLHVVMAVDEDRGASGD